MKSSYFHKDLTFMDFEVENHEELFRQVSEILEKKGYVKDTFFTALKQREEKYPTGLPTEPMAVAIPHCDAEHVIKECMVLIKPKEKVPFREMGNDENWVEASLVVVMCLKKDGMQVEALTKLMSLFAKEEFMQELVHAKTSDQLFITFMEAYEKETIEL